MWTVKCKEFWTFHANPKHISLQMNQSSCVVKFHLATVVFLHLFLKKTAFQCFNVYI